MMDLQALQTSAEQAGMAGLLASFLAGFLFSFNPVAFAAIPVSLAYVMKAHEAQRAMLYGSMFIVGMVVIHVLLGLIAGLGGQWMKSLLGRY
jgi:cytochrome c-type biogenesis protein